MTTTPDGSQGGDLAAAESLRLIAESQERARAGTEPDSRLLYLVWGLAWGAGYLVLWASARGTGAGPTGIAFAGFFVLLGAAMAITIVHSVRRGAGTRGPSARTGIMYGWSWTLGFLAYPFIISGVARAGASDEVIALIANALACVVVGLLYLAGGAAFGDTGLYALGLWILLVGGVATLAGVPGSYLVLATAGGGGFLVMAVVAHVVQTRRRTSGRRELSPGAGGAATADGPSDA